MPATRDRLLDAALDAFASRGVDGTAITDLEAAAGLAPGSGGFYRYFRTKEEVLAATVEREIDRLETEGRLPEVPAGASPRDGITEDVRRGLRALDAHRQLIAILAREQGRIPELARRVQASLVEGGVRHGADLLGPGGADGGAVAMSAVIGYHLITSYFGTPPGGLDREAFASALAALLVPVDAPSPSGAPTLA